MPDKVRVHIYISGRVQNVFFRERTRGKAEKLGVTGWVRNLADGRLEAVFEGEKDKVETIMEWAKKGPLIAKVVNFNFEWQPYQGEFNNFEIRYN